jgi:hypothetical protein
MWSRYRLNFCAVAVCAVLLAGCASTPPDRPGVKEAKACMHALNNNPRIIPGYVIEACTNNGVWVVVTEDGAGLQIARYDFVNGEYAGFETQGVARSVQELNPTITQNMSLLRKNLNTQLKEKM